MWPHEVWSVSKDEFFVFLAFENEDEEAFPHEEVAYFLLDHWFPISFGPGFYFPWRRPQACELSDQSFFDKVYGRLAGSSHGDSY